MIFIYKVTNTLNGKIYVGVHRGEPSDDYLGSGLHIKRAVVRDGVENFKREVLLECASEEEAYDLESLLVDETFIRRPDTYNLKPGGRGGWASAVKYGDDNVMRRPEVARKVSASVKASISVEERAARSTRMSALRQSGAVQRAPGWKHTEKSISLMSEKLKGKPAWNAGVKTGPEPQHVRDKKRQSAKLRAQTQDMGALTRGKKYAMKLMKCPHCGLEGKGGNMTRFHFDACKRA